MKHWRTFLVFLLALAATGESLASTPTWKGLQIRNFAQAESNPRIIYATADGGVFKSSDRGATWLPIKLPRRLQSSVVTVNPGDSTHVVVLEGSEADSSGFFESQNGGDSWTWKPVLSASSLGRLSKLWRLQIDPARFGGAWWAFEGSTLLRSTDNGKSWTVSVGAPAGGKVEHGADASYFLAGPLLMASDDRGSTWKMRHDFRGDFPVTRDAPQNFLLLKDGRLILSHGGSWLTSADGGLTWASAGGGWTALPGLSRNHFGWRTYCNASVSPANADFIVVYCAENNGAYPHRSCLWLSHDGGASFSANCANGLPQSWSATSWLLDHADPRLLLSAWMAGGVWRSADGGVSWEKSDSGLMFRVLHREDIEVPSLHEPPLYRAVMLRDAERVIELIQQGASIQASGNYIPDLLVADLLVQQAERRWGRPEASIYGFLRSLGARPAPSYSDDSAQANLLILASQLGRADVVTHLIQSGTDWGVPTRPVDATSVWRHDIGGSTMWKSASWQSVDGRDSLLAGRPIEHWMALYIEVGKFPSADATVLDLLSSDRPQLAERVLQAATRRRPFDRQRTPLTASRYQIAEALLEAKRPRWVMRLRDQVRMNPTPQECAEWKEHDILVTQLIGIAGRGAAKRIPRPKCPSH